MDVHLKNGNRDVVDKKKKKRNARAARERVRVGKIKNGFDALRSKLPPSLSRTGHMSRLDILSMAITYIKILEQEIEIDRLEMTDTGGNATATCLSPLSSISPDLVKEENTRSNEQHLIHLKNVAPSAPTQLPNVFGSNLIEIPQLNTVLPIVKPNFSINFLIGNQQLNLTESFPSPQLYVSSPETNNTKLPPFNPFILNDNLKKLDLTISMLLERQKQRLAAFECSPF